MSAAHVLALADFPALQGSAAGLLALVVLLILTGRLVPRSVLRDRERDNAAREERLTQIADAWQKAYELSVQGRKTADNHVSALLEGNEATRDVLSALDQVLADRASKSNQAQRPRTALGDQERT